MQLLSYNYCVVERRSEGLRVSSGTGEIESYRQGRHVDGSNLSSKRLNFDSDVSIYETYTEETLMSFRENIIKPIPSGFPEIIFLFCNMALVMY